MEPRDVATLYLERMRRLDQAGSGDPAEELRIKLVGIAALARDAVPTATHVRLVESDQGPNDMVVEAVVLPDGTEVDDWYDNRNLDQLSDLGNEFGYNMLLLLLPHIQDSPLVQVEGNDKHGYTMTLDIEAALASRPPVVAPADRARWAAGAYGARYDLPASGAPTFLAEALMADLQALLAEHGIETREVPAPLAMLRAVTARNVAAGNVIEAREAPAEHTPLAVLWRGEFRHFDDEITVMDVDGMLDQYSGYEVGELLEAKAALSAVYAPDDPIMVALDERIEEIRAEEGDSDD